MTRAIATVSGTALVPGVSRNKRLYTPELIGKAVARAQPRIAEGGMPLTMRIFHPKPDEESRAPVTEIVGHVTRLWQEADGRARFSAILTDTREGRDVLELVDNRNGAPTLKGVSIRGGWLGRTRRVDTGDGLAETADDLELDGLDYTHRPGVIGAEIETVSDPDEPPHEAASAGGKTLILESVQEALVTTITEADAPAKDDDSGKKPYGDVSYADPGYQKDGKKRYPLNTKQRAKSAWSYINQADNARLYTAAQLKRVKGRIKAALKKFGVQIAEEGWLVDPVGQISESVAEYFGLEGGRPGSFSVCLDNGVVCVSVSSYCIDPHDLDKLGRAAMAGACDALSAMDPDMDGDMDVPGAPAQDTDHDMDMDGDESAPAPRASVAETSPAEPASDPDDSTSVSEPATEPTTETEAVVTDATNATAVETAAPVPAAPSAITLTNDQFAQLLAAARGPIPTLAPAAPAESAPAAPAAVTEAQPAAEPVAETEEQRIDRLVQARLTEALQARVERDGPPARKGLVGRVAESGELTPVGSAPSGELNSNGLPAEWPDKPLHQYTAEERTRYLSPAVMNHVIGNRI